jgi:hypothetical protein
MRSSKSCSPSDTTVDSIVSQFGGVSAGPALGVVTVVVAASVDDALSTPAAGGAASAVLVAVFATATGWVATDLVVGLLHAVAAIVVTISKRHRLVHRFRNKIMLLQSPE